MSDEPNASITPPARGKYSRPCDECGEDWSEQNPDAGARYFDDKAPVVRWRCAACWELWVRAVI